ncbi:hypothetical protein GCM10010503_09500 [Streptomyces lucensis JCM 4490]|uniref:Uncharacterized protein n=1 Tax=Streptomyces lucensis JCM 4490 TaxID=1306176 RepID=A0A918IWR7_9ACTN|nr:hypothetical protein GCM10010503_09500 [Streptomyces lucensis JCM 4490]
MPRFAHMYYIFFRFVITRFGLRTPGREPADEAEDATEVRFAHPHRPRRAPARRGLSACPRGRPARTYCA